MGIECESVQSGHRMGSAGGFSNVGGVFFFFKQKTAYEIRNCDWSSDVCSSDLHQGHFLHLSHHDPPPHQHLHFLGPPDRQPPPPPPDRKSVV